MLSEQCEGPALTEDEEGSGYSRDFEHLDKLFIFALHEVRQFLES